MKIINYVFFHKFWNCSYLVFFECVILFLSSSLPLTISSSLSLFLSFSLPLFISLFLFVLSSSLPLVDYKRESKQCDCDYFSALSLYSTLIYIYSLPKYLQTHYLCNLQYIILSRLLYLSDNCTTVTQNYFVETAGGVPLSTDKFHTNQLSKK